MEPRRGLLWSLGSQAVVVASGGVRALVIPVLFADDLGGYAAWQAYLLYAGLVSFLLWGLNDGFMLRFHRDPTASQRRARTSGVLLGWLLASLEASALLVLVVLSRDGDAWSWGAVLLNVPLLGVYGAALYYLQMTRRYGAASAMVAVERLGFLVALPVLYATGTLSAPALVAADLLTRASVAATVVVRYRSDLVGGRPDLRLGWREVRASVRRGLPVMAGSYVVILSGSLVRLVVERTSSRVDFANYALAFSLTNVLLVMGNALSAVLFPHFSGSGDDVLARSLLRLDRVLSWLFPAFLAVAFPVTAVVQWLLPQYEEAAALVAPTLVVVAFQVVVAALNNPFYKLLGLEAALLRDNALALLILVVALAGVAAGTDEVVALVLVQAGVLAGLAGASHVRFGRRLGRPVRSSVPYDVAWAALFCGCTVLLPVGAAAALFTSAVLGVALLRWRSLRTVVVDLVGK